MHIHTQLLHMIHVVLQPQKHNITFLQELHFSLKIFSMQTKEICTYFMYSGGAQCMLRLHIQDTRIQQIGYKYIPIVRQKIKPTFFISSSRFSSSWPSVRRRLSSPSSLSTASRYWFHWARSCSRRWWNWTSYSHTVSVREKEETKDIHITNNLIKHGTLVISFVLVFLTVKKLGTLFLMLVEQSLYYFKILPFNIPFKLACRHLQYISCGQWK